MEHSAVCLFAKYWLFFFFFNFNIGWSPYWVHSAMRPLLAYCTCPGWLWGWRSWWNERFWQGKLKYSEKTCPDATLSTTNPTCQTWVWTWAAAVGNQRLTASAMVRPKYRVTECCMGVPDRSYTNLKCVTGPSSHHVNQITYIEHSLCHKTNLQKHGMYEVDRWYTTWKANYLHTEKHDYAVLI
jgi:hypothetical protein